MDWLRIFASRIRGLFDRGRSERELADEVRDHLDRLTEQYLRSGLNEKEARTAALRSFGGVEQVKEVWREQRTPAFLEVLGQDLRFALRQLRRSPGFAAAAIITLALGIGACTAIFSVVNAVLLRPLPYKEPDRLVMVWGVNQPRGYNSDLVSPSDLRDWQSQSHSFDGMAGSTDVMYTLTGTGEPTSIVGYQLSSDYFRVLGVTPLLGRTFSQEEEQPGKNRVVVLGHRIWRSRFGGDRGLLGRSIILDGAPYTVLGVMPPNFQFPPATELWTPLTVPAEPAHDRSYRFLRVLARLRSGVTLKQAQTDMSTIAARLAAAYPKTNRDEGINIVSLREMTTGDIRQPLLLLLYAVGSVLLIACVNVAGLMLARAVKRQREVAVRRALGANRSRLVRQLLTESVLVGMIGGAVGLGLAYFCADALVAMFPPTISNLSIPRMDRIPIDWRVLIFAFSASLMTGLTFGLAPAFQACSLDANEVLKESSRSLTSSRQGRRFRSVLVTVEVALSLVLLVAAGLTIKSFMRLLRGDLGFKPDYLLSMRILLPEYKYGSEARQLAFSDQAIARIKFLPGVRSVGTVTFLPLSGWWGVRRAVMESQAASRLDRPSAVWSSVTPGYFRSMDIPLLRGRFFTDQDAQGRNEVAILSASLARRLSPDDDSVGKQIVVEGISKPLEVVGIVGDVHQLGLTSEQTSEIYLPFAQFPTQLMCFTIRTAGDPTSLSKAAQREIWEVDRNQAISHVMSMKDLALESLAPQRVVALVLAAFAVVALMLAAVGLYGVIAYSAGQRTHEIGIRVALGAGRSQVLRLIVSEGLKLTMLGLGLGLIAATAAAHLLSSVLYGVAPNDITIFLGVSILATGVALLASYIPARRAARLDPITALRHD